MSIDNGGPAFPIEGGEQSLLMPHYGLSKRDWFAGMALQGLISGCFAGNNSGFTVDGNVVAAFEYADAMLRGGKGEK